jgi:hypothetical protein
MLLDLMTDVAWEIEVLLDAVAYCSEQVSCFFKGVVSINDDTSHILATVL